MKTVLFDLDGTLLPMDQDAFVRGYFGYMVRMMAPHGYEGEKLIRTIWAGTAAMVGNDGSCSNEEAFWRCFASVYGEEARRDIPLFEEFYATEFQKARSLCGFTPKAAQTLQLVRALGADAVLATNPLFPAVATESRIRWAGLEPEEFLLYTTYENSSFCKPNPEYYREILSKLRREPEDCIMVGNDALEDMAAETLGMKTFLLTDCLINTKHADIGAWPHGGYRELHAFLRAELGGAETGKQSSRTILCHGC